jgi:hypothetical protein
MATLTEDRKLAKDSVDKLGMQKFLKKKVLFYGSATQVGILKIK